MIECISCLVSIHSTQTHWRFEFRQFLVPFKSFSLLKFQSDEVYRSEFGHYEKTVFGHRETIAKTLVLFIMI